LDAIPDDFTDSSCRYNESIFKDLYTQYMKLADLGLNFAA